MTTTVTSLFEHYEDATDAVRDLQAAGVSDEEISLVANHPKGQDNDANLPTDNSMAESGAASGAAIGGVLGGGAGLLAALGAFTIPGIGPVVGAGWLLAASVGAAVGASGGGVLGTLIGAGVSKDQAHVYVEGLRQGGTLVSARVADEKVQLVQDIMSRHNALDRLGHTIERPVIVTPPTTPPG